MPNPKVLGALTSLFSREAPAAEAVNLGRRSMFGLPQIGEALPAIIPDAQLSTSLSKPSLSLEQIVNTVGGAPTRRGMLKQAAATTLRNAIPAGALTQSAATAARVAPTIAKEVAPVLEAAPYSIGSPMAFAQALIHSDSPLALKAFKAHAEMEGVYPLEGVSWQEALDAYKRGDASEVMDGGHKWFFRGEGPEDAEHVLQQSGVPTKRYIDAEGNHQLHADINSPELKAIVEDANSRFDPEEVEFMTMPVSKGTLKTLTPYSE